MSQWCHIIFTEMLRKVREKSAEEGPTYSIGKAKGTFNVTFITNSSTTETTFNCTTTIKPTRNWKTQFYQFYQFCRTVLYQ